MAVPFSLPRANNNDRIGYVRIEVLLSELLIMLRWIPLTGLSENVVRQRIMYINSYICTVNHIISMISPAAVFQPRAIVVNLLIGVVVNPNIDVIIPIHIPVNNRDVEIDPRIAVIDPQIAAFIPRIRAINSEVAALNSQAANANPEIDTVITASGNARRNWRLRFLYIMRHFAADQQEVAANQQDVAANQQDAAANQQDAAVNQQDAASDQQDAAVDQQEAAVDQQEAAVDQQEAAADQQNAAADQQDVSAIQQNATEMPQNAAAMPHNAMEVPQNAAEMPQQNAAEMLQNAVEMLQNAAAMAQNAAAISQNAAAIPQTATATPQNTAVIPRNSGANSLTISAGQRRGTRPGNHHHRRSDHLAHHHQRHHRQQQQQQAQEQQQQPRQQQQIPDLIASCTATWTAPMPGNDRDKSTTKNIVLHVELCPTCYYEGHQLKVLMVTQVEKTSNDNEKQGSSKLKQYIKSCIASPKINSTVLTAVFMIIGWKMFTKQ